MPDLEQLIRERQDLLRGRPRHLGDDIVDWWRGFDLERRILELFIVVCCAAEIAVWLLFFGLI